MVRIVLDALSKPTDGMIAYVAAACSKRDARDDDSDIMFMWRAVIAAAREEIEHG